MTSNPTRTKLAVAFYSASRLDIYESDGSLVRSVTGPRDLEVKFRTADDRFFWDKGNELAYTAITASAGFVFALFCGCPLGDDEQPGRRRFHAWTWEGEFVGEYEFLGEQVYTIVAAEDGKQLFGAVKEPFPRVAIWDLPSEIRSP